MEVQSLEWEEIEEGFRYLGKEAHSEDDPAASVPVLDLDSFMPLLKKAFDKESGQEKSIGFMKMQYGKGEVISHRNGYTRYAAVILNGSLRLLFDDMPDRGVISKDHSCWGRPGKIRRWLESRPERSSKLGNLLETAGDLIRRTGLFEKRGARRFERERQLSEPLSEGRLKSSKWKQLIEKTIVADRRFIGLASALWTTPRTGTLISDDDDPCSMLLIHRSVLEGIRAKDSQFDEYIDRHFLSDILHGVLRGSALMRGLDLPDSLFLKFSDYGEVDRILCNPGDVVYQPDDQIDGIYLVMAGVIQDTFQVQVGQSVNLQHEQGGFFGHWAPTLEPRTHDSTARALTRSTVIKIGEQALRKICEEFPAVEERLRASKQKRLTAIDKGSAEKVSPVRLPDSLQARMRQGRNLLLIDMEACTRCGQCVQACADQHDGIPRFTHSNPDFRFGKWQIASACVQCYAPAPCQEVCPADAISTLQTGMVHIHRDRCVACGLCDPACPFGVIEMLPRYSEHDAPKTTEKKEFNVATKCDLCVDEHRDPPCVASCPYDAAYRGSPDQLIEKIEEWSLPLPMKSE